MEHEFSTSTREKKQIEKSFTTTGISEELSQLKEKNELHSCLVTLIDDCLDSLDSDRKILDDSENPYSDPRDTLLRSLASEQDLEIIES